MVAQLHLSIEVCPAHLLQYSGKKVSVVSTKALHPIFGVQAVRGASTLCCKYRGIFLVNVLALSKAPII